MDREAIERGRQGPGGAIPPGPPATTGGDRNGARAAGADRRALGYGRLSPGERKDAQAENGKAKVGVGMVDQRQKVEGWCTYKSCDLVEFVDVDVDHSGKTLDRPGMQDVLRRMDAGEADVLVAARLDRLARSVRAFGELLERSQKGGWAIVVLDFDLDTSTATGRMVANLMMTVAQWQRESIGENTRDALAVKKAQGVQLGRRSTLPVEVVERINHERGSGLSYQAIADGLNADGVPTGQGAAGWRKQSVAAVLARQDGG